jgi:hypothetical protein
MPKDHLYRVCPTVEGMKTPRVGSFDTSRKRTHDQKKFDYPTLKLLGGERYAFCGDHSISLLVVVAGIKGAALSANGLAFDGKYET